MDVDAGKTLQMTRGNTRNSLPPLQTFYGRQPSFSGCCRQDLERTAGQSRLNNVITVFPASFEDIFVSAIFLLALQWT